MGSACAHTLTSRRAASSILEAITLHDGEARIIRDRFLALPTARQEAIIAFVNWI
jgi:CxxC motif-containing protein (DUF1111 family)